ncbi:hypothetical protein KP509_37G014800 [Ceratopteris richardii]|uniref:Amino acid transporter transmembrane domain-containing protein n=1 Tax=Ceratopteris richardii TaxID=49495 RepID=A0A8T2Q6X9_CERRI|nr:hypothetical protein KP509_37G014800 [Ceratopteris richardii]
MVTSSVSMMNIARTMCFQKNREVSQCDTPISTFMIIFGGAQVALSQIPTFSKTWWLSILASTMTMTYCSLGVVLGMKKIIHGVNLEHGSGERFFSDKKLSFDTLWPIFQAIGNIALGYTCIILIEIQDTIKYPFEVITMKKANTTGVSITTCLYVFIACMGYGAFGSDAPGNLLEGFSFIDTYWLIGFANFCVILQLVGACQVYAQVIFAITEEWILGHFPKSKLLHKSFSITLWNGRHALNFNLFLLLWRTTYVVSLTIVSILLPFFTSILGVLGALGFWPLTVYFPVEMHLTQSKAQRWTKTWIIFEGVSMFCFFVSILALVGSIAGIIDSLKV